MKKSLLRSILLTSAIFVLSGCGHSYRCIGKATTAIDLYTFKSYEKVKSGMGRLPAINAMSEASIGETMVRTFVHRQKIIPILILNEDITHAGKYCDHPVTITAKKGTYRLKRETEEGRLFFSEDNNIAIEVPKAVRDLNNGLSWSSAKRGIYIPNDRLKPAGIFWNGWEDYSGYDDCFRMEPIPRPDFTISEKSESISNGYNDFKRELAYNGKSGNTVFIIYREFSDNMARPAFTTEIKYDLSDTKIIGYKNARFEVIDATNMAIRYKVLKHLK